MFGASLLKVIKYIAAGVAMTGSELVILVIGTLVAFIVSVFVIKFLMSYIKKHDFKVFGWYRIVLGILDTFNTQINLELNSFNIFYKGMALYDIGK